MRGTEPVSSNEKIARLKILTKTGIKGGGNDVPSHSQDDDPDVLGERTSRRLVRRRY